MWYKAKWLRSGGGCINNTMSHCINPDLPFGGIRYSQIGRYHPKYSFDEFLYEKGIIKSTGKFEANLIYPPYNDRNLKTTQKLIE